MNQLVRNISNDPNTNYGDYEYEGLERYLMEQGGDISTVMSVLEEFSVLHLIHRKYLSKDPSKRLQEIRKYTNWSWAKIQSLNQRVERLKYTFPSLSESFNRRADNANKIYTGIKLPFRTILGKVIGVLNESNSYVVYELTENDELVTLAQISKKGYKIVWGNKSHSVQEQRYILSLKDELVNSIL